jgi:hypothetical protein
MFYYLQENGEKTANAVTDNKYPESSLPYATGPILVDPNFICKSSSKHSICNWSGRRAGSHLFLS